MAQTRKDLPNHMTTILLVIFYLGLLVHNSVFSFFNEVLESALKWEDGGGFLQTKIVWKIFSIISASLKFEAIKALQNHVT